MSTKINKDSSWDEWYGEAAKKNPCQVDFERLKKWEGLTLDEIFKSSLTKEDKVLWELSSTWALKFLDSSPELRLKFINNIMDPMVAFNIYISIENLTDEEDTLLKTKFEGKLPTAEKELRTGIVSRSKVGVGN